MKCPLCSHRTRLSKRDRTPAYRELAQHLLESHPEIVRYDSARQAYLCPCGASYAAQTRHRSTDQWFEDRGVVLELAGLLAVHLMHVGDLKTHLVDAVLRDLP